MAPLGSLPITLILALLCQIVASSTIPHPQWPGIERGPHPPRIGTPAPSEGRMTNAKRFAAGLPPLPPARSKRRAIHAPRQSTSPTNPGVVRFSFTDGSVLPAAVTQSISTVLMDDIPSNPNVPFDLNDPINGIFLGVTPPGITLTTDGTGFADLMQVLDVSPSATPVHDMPQPGEAYETTFWYYVPDTSQLAIHWNDGLGNSLNLNIWLGFDSSGQPVLPLILAFRPANDPIVMNARPEVTTWKQVAARVTIF